MARTAGEPERLGRREDAGQQASLEWLQAEVGAGLAKELRPEDAFGGRRVFDWAHPETLPLDAVPCLCRHGGQASDAVMLGWTRSSGFPLILWSRQAQHENCHDFYRRAADQPCWRSPAPSTNCSVGSGCCAGTPWPGTPTSGTATWAVLRAAPDPVPAPEPEQQE